MGFLMKNFYKIHKFFSTFAAAKAYRKMTHIYQSPYGALLLEAAGGSLCRCSWALSVPEAGTPMYATSADGADLPVMAQAVSQLDEYFRGERRTFSLPLSLQGTPFCLKVWRRLLSIPYGATVSYKHLARLVGCPQGQRAVAMACSRNPMSIIVPCHRVISSSGKPGGYTLHSPGTRQSPGTKPGSCPAGKDIKTRLLALESSASSLFAPAPH